jgi:hypothetical protein
MPLINLKTNLKSLRFGSDRPGSGTSAYTSKILEPLSPSKANSFDLPLSEIGQTGGTDFIIRGGKYAEISARKDFSRLRRLFTDTPTGISFLAKQEALGLTGQRYGAGGPTNGLQSEGVYLPTSTLLAAGPLGGVIGNHPNKQGVNPYPTQIFGLNFNVGGRPTYLDYIYGSTTNLTPAENPVFNRLVHLSVTAPYNTSGTLFTYQGGPNSLGFLGETRIKFSQGNRTGKANPNLGGTIDKTIKFFSTEALGYNDYSVFKNPRSVITQGSKIFSGTPAKWKTASGLYFDAMLPININDAYKVSEGYKKDNLQGALRTFDNNVYKPGGLKTDQQVAFPTFAATLTQEQLANQTPVSRGGNIQDFRRKVTVNNVIASRQGTLTKSPDYNNPNVRFENRVVLGDPGSVNLDRSNYQKGAIDVTTRKVNVVDKINALYMYESDFVTGSPNKNDFVKFRIAVINPDNPTKKTFTHFRAIFSSDISDNINANWNSFKYLGRGEDFYQYTGFSRDISLSFTVYAQSKPELSIMYQKLNYLQSSLAPNFSSNGFMRGNIHQLTIGGYLYEQPGVITNLNYSIPSDSTWEIGIPSNFLDAETAPDVSGVKVDPQVKELAHRIEVSLTYRPIHTFLPQIIGSAYDRPNNPKGINGNSSINQRFLQLTNDGDENGSNSLYSKVDELGGVPFATPIK